jgi:hypothetical protein
MSNIVWLAVAEDRSVPDPVVAGMVTNPAEPWPTMFSDFVMMIGAVVTMAPEASLIVSPASAALT